MDTHNLLVVNPGSTSTKIALFQDDNQVCAEVWRHNPDALHRCAELWDQFDLRWNDIHPWICRNVRTLSAVAGMGGLLQPVTGGTYAVNERMLADARAGLRGLHAANLGCALAHKVAGEFRCPAFVVDPVSVDEFEPLARYSGHPAIERQALSHALNIHAAARRAADYLGVRLDASAFIVAHLGGGISVAPVRNGRIIDVNDAASDGPFSPERTGGLPLQPFIGLCFGGRSEREMRTLVMGKGGLVAYLGTNSAMEVEQRVRAGDATAREVYQAMAYQIAKEIGAMATVLRGDVQAIVLTGGLASSSLLTSWIIERVQFLAQPLVFPGEDEMKAMALGVLRVLRGQTKALEY